MENTYWQAGMALRLPSAWSRARVIDFSPRSRLMGQRSGHQDAVSFD